MPAFREMAMPVCPDRHELGANPTVPIIKCEENRGARARPWLRVMCSLMDTHVDGSSSVRGRGQWRENAGLLVGMTVSSKADHVGIVICSAVAAGKASILSSGQAWLP